MTGVLGKGLEGSPEGTKKRHLWRNGPQRVYLLSSHVLAFRMRIWHQHQSNIAWTELKDGDGKKCRCLSVPSRNHKILRPVKV